MWALLHGGGGLTFLRERARAYPTPPRRAAQGRVEGAVVHRGFPFRGAGRSRVDAAPSPAAIGVEAPFRLPPRASAQAVALELVVERADADAEALGGQAAIAAGLAQGLDDGAALQV